MAKETNSFKKAVKKTGNFFAKVGSFITNRTSSMVLQIAALLIFAFFLIVPLIIILTKAGGNDYSYVFQDNRFFDGLKNSLLYSFVGAAISTVLATLVAYLLSRIHIKGKKWIVLGLTIPMLIPTISIGLGVKEMFKSTGVFNMLFHTGFDGLGYFDLILGSTIFSFPIAFLLIYDAFLYEDRSVYDAANTLGISRLRTFFSITIPYLKSALISAFFSAFILIFADYGLPLEVGGKVTTLPTYLYNSMKGTYINYGRAAVVCLVLLTPALLSFIIDIFNKESASGAAKEELIKPSKTFTNVSLVIIILSILLLAIPQIVFILMAFVEFFPNDMSITLRHFEDAFNPNSAIYIGESLSISLIVSLLAGIIGTIFAYVTAYLSTRAKGKLKKPLHLFSIVTLAVPGLVLGAGYYFFFKGTRGVFYDTILIIVIANIIHYFSSPYLMARNAFNKIDKNYETVADTLGVSRFKLFFTVMIPNSVSTILAMFSYFFINSMITISAVMFLIDHLTPPMAVAISVVGESIDSLEKKAVISFFILLINLSMKIVFDLVGDLYNKHHLNKEEKKMSLSRFQFDFLTYIERHQHELLTQRKIADAITLSLGTINKLYNESLENDYIIVKEDKTIQLSEKGRKILEPYLVKKAIIIAAGFGSRMAPVTLDTPKPLVKVNGVRIIDTLIDALLANDITNITIIVGYKKEQFKELLEKYPMLKFIENPIYNESNNISSLYYAKDIIDRCYICEADLIVSNPKVIKKYQYTSNYLGAYVKETDDWCFKKKNNYIKEVNIGGENVWHMIGISYWNEADAAKLREDLEKVFHSRGGKENYWDNVPLKICKKDFKIEVRDCNKKDVTEIDNYSELVIIDPSYANYPNHKM